MTNLRALLAGRNAKLAAGGAAVVATVALARSRRRSDASPAGANPTRPTYQGAAVYDSTASDVYSSLMPQLEQFARDLEELRNRTDPARTPPTAPAPPAPRPVPRQVARPRPGPDYVVTDPVALYQRTRALMPPRPAATPTPAVRSV